MTDTATASETVPVTAPGAATTSAPASATSATTSVSAAEPAIRLRDVRRRFGRSEPVLEGIDLDVAAGEFVCLIGASGSGKSTLLSLIAGLDRPSAGTVEVPDEGAAVMFQEASLMPWLTASRNVELALRLRGVPRGERRARAGRLLELVGLAHAADLRPHALSGGMRQRIALARSLAQDRPLLLMDEPFAALDAITRDVLHDELERVWRTSGRTIVFVTHNVHEAVRLGQRIVLLASRPGRIAAEWRTDAASDAAGQDALVREITARLRREVSG